MNVNKIKEDFPIFKRFSKEGIVYLDNAATTQKPYAVINAVKDFTENHNANVHRGVYRLGEEATELYNEAREKVSRLIGANPNNIIFVRNATEALNLGANGLVSMMKPGGDILISRMEHHSNIVPWQLLREKNNFHIRYIRNEQDQIIDWKTVEENLTDRTEIVSLTQCSNLLGNINDLKDVGNHLHNLGIKFMVDAAQSVPHMPVNAKGLNCDLLAFSGHKMLGPTGIGCLFGTDEILEEMPPFLGGGEMIKEVYEDHFVPADVPDKFEAGTPNVEGAIGLGAAVDYLKGIGMDQVRKHERELIAYTLKRESELNMDELISYGTRNVDQRAGIFTFNIKKNGEIEKPFGNEIHPHDISHLADNLEGVQLRSGHHCAMPETISLGVYASARASYYIYNDERDVDHLFDSIEKMHRRMIIK